MHGKAIKILSRSVLAFSVRFKVDLSIRLFLAILMKFTGVLAYSDSSGQMGAIESNRVTCLLFVISSYRHGYRKITINLIYMYSVKTCFILFNAVRTRWTYAAVTFRNVDVPSPFGRVPERFEKPCQLRYPN